MTIINLWHRLSPRKGKRVKVPTVLQMEAAECGAASLAMILAYYGLWIPLEKLRIACGVSRDGSKAGNVMRAAQNYGMEAHGYRWDAESLRAEAAYPLIIFWEFKHFLVLEGIRGEIVYLNDPAVGRRSVSWAEFLRSYTGIAVTLRPGAAFKPAGKRYNAVKALAQKLKQDKAGILFLSALGLGLIVPGLTMPLITQVYVDNIITGSHREWMANLGVIMLLTFALSVILTWLKSMLLTRWYRKLTLVESSACFRHLLRLPLRFFQQRYTADVVGRIAMNERIAEVISGIVASAVLDAGVALFFLLLMVQYSPFLTAIGIFLLGVNVAVPLLWRDKTADMAMRLEQDAGKEYSVLLNGLTMMDSIKASGAEPDFFRQWIGCRAKVLIGKQERDMLLLKARFLPMLLTGFNGAIIMTFGGFSIMDGAMTVGMLVAFQQLADNFQKPIHKLAELYPIIQTTEMQMQRLHDVRNFSVDKLNYPTSTATGFERSRLSGELDLVDISFGYSPLEPPLIERFNLHLEPGRWVALVGASGSGKSTLAKIITGLYEEEAGEVRLDGVPRRQIPRGVILNSLAAVDQETFQITGTVRQNIALFDDSLRQSDIIQAAKDACIHDDILRLNGGYEALVTEGGRNFSGGERQRLEIARALAKNPSLLVLDEATGALDSATEKAVFDNIRHRGCACVIIAHRLSTVRDCDEIIVLERGKVVERGKHSELIRHDGLYRRLNEA